MFVMRKILSLLSGMFLAGSTFSQTPEQISKIEKMLGDYKYGQYSLIENEPKITEVDTGYNHVTFIENFYSEGNKSKKGTCMELSNKLYEEINKMENISVYKVFGQEPRFFYGGNSSHYFLALTESPRENVEELLKSNPLIVDPSYGFVSKIENSGYKISMIKEKVSSNGIAKIPFHYSVPLGFDNENLVIYLPMGEKSTIVKVNKSRGAQERNISKNMRGFIKNKDIIKMVRSLRKAPFKIVKD